MESVDYLVLRLDWLQRGQSPPADQFEEATVPEPIYVDC